jgi:acrylyl-CoA reductase (NADPH)
MQHVTALRVHDEAGRIQARLERIDPSELGAGEVLIRAEYSSLNYKDALAVTGKGRILRRLPLVAGIDVAGSVAASDDPAFEPGARVVVTGCGLGEEHDGGFAEYVRVPASWVIRLPASLSTREAMQLGTAGFTAGLAIERMERNGTTPAAGPVVVTGATGGVGSLAVDMLAKAGYQVTAVTGKAAQAEYLRALGAAEVLLAGEIELGQRPLERARWGAAVDSVGGELLTWITRTMKPWGNIGAIGLAGGHELNTTVMPFILRGVSLLGINSVDTPRELRERVWHRLAGELKPRHLDKIARHETTLDGLVDAAEALLNRQVIGRYVVKI